MAPPSGTLRVGRYFLALLVLLAILYSIVAFGPRATPKLGLDLVGGTQVIVTATGKTPTSTNMETARQIIADRVNGTGVTEATVVIQGDNQIVVSIPGDSNADVQSLVKAAVLNFRGVVAAPVPVTCVSSGSGSSSSSSASASPSASASSAGGSSSSAVPASSPSGSTSAAASGSASGSASNSGAAAAVRPLGKAPSTGSAASTSAKASGSASASTSAKASSSAGTSATPSGSASSSSAPVPCSSTSVAQAAQVGNFTVPLTDTAYSALSSTNQQLVSAGLADFDCASAQNAPDVAKNYYVACADGTQYGLSGGKVAFLLGPVIVAGKQIDTASAVAPNAQQGQVAWTVALELKSSGQSAWAKYTTAHNVNGASDTAGVGSCSSTGTPCADYVGFTLDGAVISSPVNLQGINGGTTSITGNFTSKTANDLANQLKYGALPINFRSDQAQTVSATLGTAQLKAGLLAGGIGLVLVVIYSLIYYRALGLVTIASLLVSGALTYGSLVLLGTQIGFTLSLAGIAGFIVAVGITADSFVVFFERLKDEVHEGRSVRVAVPRAWVRARRTILSADTVSFLAAAILYYFAAGDVKGFAFTLGLSTILDVAVVFLFTHPMVSLLSRSRAFGSARFTGLDALRAPAVDHSRAARAGRRSERGAAPARTRTATAVLDDPVDTDDDLLDAPAPDVRVADVTHGEPVPADDVDADDDAVHDDAGDDDSVDDDGRVDDGSGDGGSAADEPARKRTAPEPGSAAERAAARRARMREQRNEGKGQD